MGQERILLALVETVDFVDEQQGAGPAGSTTLLGRFDDATHLGDATHDGGKTDERGAGAAGDDRGDGRFAASRRPPKNGRPQIVALDRDPQRFAGREERLLSGDFIQRTGPHPRGKGSIRTGVHGLLRTEHTPVRREKIHTGNCTGPDHSRD